MKAIYRFLIAGLLAVTFSQGVYARDGWEFQFTPYLWAAGQKGTVATLPGAGPVSIDLSFGDILEELDLAVMGVFEARRGPWGLIADLQYVDVDTKDVDTPGPVLGSIRYDQQVTIMTVGGTYRWATENGFVDVIGAARLTDVDNTLRVGAGGMVPPTQVNGQDDWEDLMLGVRGNSALNDKWSLGGWAMFAAAGDSDRNLDFYGGINYHLRDNMVITGGYRHIVMDYEKDGFIYDVDNSGPLMGFTIAW